MDEEAAFDRLMHEVCIKQGWCGGIVDGQQKHVTDFLPGAGAVSADQFAAWLFEADGVDPDEDRAKWQPHIDGLRTAFIRHMGADQVDVGRLNWSDS